MESSNETLGNRFILLGLNDIPYLQAVGILSFLSMYIFTLTANVLLIIVVRINSQLQTPMYFFLSNLSIIDIGFSSTIVPKLIVITLARDKSISLLECSVQMFAHLSLGATECIILAVMAYDRYAAICKPLHYNRIMNWRFCICLAAGCWSVGLLNACIQVVYTFKLSFCGSRHLNHFFCEMPSFFRLSCQDTWFNELSMYVASCIVGLSSFLLTLLSYVHIISTVLKIQSDEGNHKAFSTCASHLTVISLYYTTVLFMYLRPHSSYSPETDKVVAIIYTAVTPMLNPIIYSMRNKDIKITIQEKVIKKLLK
ncbi:hypothetical protein GDO86_016573 [Hymenochirus boettgeri]|uniref:Olfactory receptor n=1 Tax=Hymenochirus boettgeri TaxID=247094 RepID=A0A8T2K2V4_9PIPI|nr:hypothetical protein GDO86_016573 [Hymenochirus boettgeri]